MIQHNCIWEEGCIMLDKFSVFLEQNKKSKNTIKGYLLDLNEYFKWFSGSYDKECKMLLRQNVLEFKSYLQNIKRNNAKTINHKLCCLKKYNEFLIESGIQKDLVINNKDMIKLQREYVSPTKISEIETKQFLQAILENGNKRNYAIAVILAYGGLRISEALNIQMDDFNLESGECIIRNGKGDKQRIVIINSKITMALKEYLIERNNYITAKESSYLFITTRSLKMDRSSLNRIFHEYNSKITPHQLRHFFCTNAIEKNISIHEVAYQAGHSNIHTTLLYTNPDRKKLKNKLELL